MAKNCKPSPKAIRLNDPPPRKKRALSPEQNDVRAETRGSGAGSKATQWPRGVSGNPAGRPRGSKNLRTDLREELEGKIVVTENGTKKKLTRQRAMVKRLSNAALQGDVKAIEKLLNLAQRFQLDVEQKSRFGNELTRNDEEILRRYEEKVIALYNAKEGNHEK